MLATPARTHFALGQQALLAGKHLFVEKPLTMDLAEGEQLVALADSLGAILMVGHVFEFNPAVRYIKDAIDSGDLGDVLYLYSKRVNLGRVQSDVNALWSIAPHDISIALYLLGQMPVSVRCQGARCLNGQVEDVIFLTLNFPGNLLCHVHASWLDPSKMREMTVVGSRKMIVYDDVSAEGKVRVYDKGAFRKGDVTYGDYQYKLHSGDILIPRLDLKEPLQEECAHFVACVRGGTRPLTDGPERPAGAAGVGCWPAKSGVRWRFGGRAAGVGRLPQFSCPARRISCALWGLTGSGRHTRCMTPNRYKRRCGRRWCHNDGQCCRWFRRGGRHGRHRGSSRPQWGSARLRRK